MGTPPPGIAKERSQVQNNMSGDFPTVKSTHSLVAKHVTKDKWDKLKDITTKTSGFTLAKAIACAVEFDNQHCGIYAGDWDSYKDFAAVFDPIIQEYHGIKAGAKHTSDMDVGKITGNISSEVPVHSTRIRVGRSIDGFGLSPGITKEQRVQMESLMKNALKTLTGDLAGTYYPLTGMDEKVRQQLVDDHFLFMSGDANLTVAGMERDWPEGRGIFHNEAKTFLIWVNEEDQLRIISMQQGGDVAEVFDRLCRACAAIEKVAEFSRDDHLGYITSCPTNLGTALRASVHIKLPKLMKNKEKFNEIADKYYVQIRGIHGEHTETNDGVFDISNRRRLGRSEKELVQDMINGVQAMIKAEKAEP